MNKITILKTLLMSKLLKRLTPIISYNKKLGITKCNSKSLKLRETKTTPVIYEYDDLDFADGYRAEHLENANEDVEDNTIIEIEDQTYAGHNTELSETTIRNKIQDLSSYEDSKGILTMISLQLEQNMKNTIKITRSWR